ncbi:MULTISPECIES: transcriptional regulator [Frankia]|uniref:Transcriptional regulator n=1 Tax=Frankia umida TaxID=573489 RepID=A0ABT0K0Q1_9ACTN|nr:MULTISPECIES: transcriptional regulator [Frankia]MCK9877363.1 transcriptional regulator [Frankia umida]
MGLDALLNAPVRLRLASLLAAVSELEFVTLREALGVSDSVLSKQVTALTQAGYARSRKGTHQDRRTTWIALTRPGHEALRAHVAALRAIIADVD